MVRIIGFSDNVASPTTVFLYFESRPVFTMFSIYATVRLCDSKDFEHMKSLRSYLKLGMINVCVLVAIL